MTRIPLDPIGYSVENGTIHTRYAGDHASKAQRTRTAKGVKALLDGAKGKLCSECYPSPQYAASDRPSTPQKRRKPGA